MCQYVVWREYKLIVGAQAQYRLVGAVINPATRKRHHLLLTLTLPLILGWNHFCPRQQSNKLWEKSTSIQSPRQRLFVFVFVHLHVGLLGALDPAFEWRTYLDFCRSMECHSASNIIARPPIIRLHRLRFTPGCLSICFYIYIRRIIPFHPFKSSPR